MKDCEHSETEKKEVSKTYLGETFTFLADVCCQCDSYCMDNELSDQYEDWKKKLYKEKPHLFTFTVQLDINSYDTYLILRHFSDGDEPMTLSQTVRRSLSYALD